MGMVERFRMAWLGLRQFRCLHCTTLFLPSELDIGWLLGHHLKGFEGIASFIRLFSIHFSISTFHFLCDPKAEVATQRNAIRPSFHPSPHHSQNYTTT